MPGRGAPQGPAFLDTPQTRGYYRADFGQGPNSIAASFRTDLDLDAVRRELPDGVVGGRFIHHELVGSTMDEGRRLGGAGAPDGTVVVAEEQTAGRGRFNRAWASPRGENLVFSVLLRPTLAQLPYVNMAATLAVCEAVEGLTVLKTAIKWPNDVRTRGRKLSGILVETVLESAVVDFAVVGIGINVNFDPRRFPEIAQTATSIFVETGRKADRTRVLTEALRRLDALYRRVRDGESLVGRWAPRLETLGRDVVVRAGERVLRGRALSVDEQGNLVLARPDGSTLTVAAGEVTSQV